MGELLDIKEVVRRTGLTSRALRYYETRGLLKPVRTHKDRRLYGVRELERINQIVALKQAGLTLGQIEKILVSRPPDLLRLIDAQTAALAVRQQEISDALKRLAVVRALLGKGEVADVATLCELIRDAGAPEKSAEWHRRMLRNLMSDENARSAAERMWARLSRIDPREHRRKALDLYARIEAALPLDIDSAEALAFHQELQALQAPFKTMFATDDLPPPPPIGIEEATERIDRWSREAHASASGKVFQFIFVLESEQARKHGAAGHMQ